MRISGFSSRAAVPAALLLIVGAAYAGLRLRTGEGSGTTAPLAVERLEIMTRHGAVPFEAEMARTHEQQALGLMYRTELGDGKGMLFTYAEPRELTMWMRNTYIPLDMIFIRADGTVMRIEERAQPMSDRVISSKGEATAVLEIAGGAASRLGIAPGDTVRHVHFKNVPH
jgi:hypothetical protein